MRVLPFLKCWYLWIADIILLSNVTSVLIYIIHIIKSVLLKCIIAYIVSNIIMLLVFINESENLIWMSWHLCFLSEYNMKKNVREYVHKTTFLPITPVYDKAIWDIQTQTGITFIHHSFTIQYHHLSPEVSVLHNIQTCMMVETELSSIQLLLIILEMFLFH